MKKLKLDLDRLAVQSFETNGIAVADLRGGYDSVDHYNCRHAASQGGADTACAGTVEGFAGSRNPDYCRQPSGQHTNRFARCCHYGALATDPPICPTGPGCTVPDTLAPNRTCTC